MARNCEGGSFVNCAVNICLHIRTKDQGICIVFCIPQVPFSFEFELNDNSATKQWTNYHLSVLEKLVKWPNGNSVIVFTPSCHSAIWLTYPNLININLTTVLLPNFHSTVQTQTQTGPEVFRKHIYCKFKYVNTSYAPSAGSEKLVNFLFIFNKLTFCVNKAQRFWFIVLWILYHRVRVWVSQLSSGEGHLW